MYTVAILESKPNIRKLVMMTLGDSKFRYLEATDATSGISMVLKELPDFIICSDDLSGKSGIEICRTIKKAHGLAQIPFILLCSGQRPSESQLAEAGVNGVVLKKLLSRFLRDEVKKVLSQPTALPSTDSADVRSASDSDSIVVSEQEGDDASEMPLNSSPSRPTLYRKKASLTKLQEELLLEGYKTPADEVGVFSPTEGSDFDRSARSYDDPFGFGAGRAEYRDPVQDFLKDVVGPQAQEVIPQPPQPPIKTVKSVPPQEPYITKPKLSKLEPKRDFPIDDDRMREAIRKACVDVLREIIPDLKNKLISSLEERLKELK